MALYYGKLQCQGRQEYYHNKHCWNSKNNDWINNTTTTNGTATAAHDNGWVNNTTTTSKWHCNRIMPPQQMQITIVKDNAWTKYTTKTNNDKQINKSVHCSTT